jgi:hypothetical protein
LIIIFIYIKYHILFVIEMETSKKSKVQSESDALKEEEKAPSRDSTITYGDIAIKYEKTPSLDEELLKAIFEQASKRRERRIKRQKCKYAVFEGHEVLLLDKPGQKLYIGCDAHGFLTAGYQEYKGLKVSPTPQFVTKDSMLYSFYGISGEPKYYLGSDEQMHPSYLPSFRVSLLASQDKSAKDEQKASPAFAREVSFGLHDKFLAVGRPFHYRCMSSPEDPSGPKRETAAVAKIILAVDKDFKEDLKELMRRECKRFSPIVVG